MPGIGIGVSFILDAVPTDCTPCSTCGEPIVTTMHKLYLSVNSSLSETGFDLIDTNRVYCETCKPEI